MPRRIRALFALTLLGLAPAGAAGSPVPAPLETAATPDADAIFAATRAALLARTYPNEIKYAVVVEGWDGKVWRGRTYDSFAFPAKNEIREKTVSREENANPYKPSQFGFSVLGINATKGGDSPPDALGVPKLSPTYVFGLVPGPHAPAPEPQAPVPGAPETIGQVSAIAKIYDVSLVGPETIRSLPCWHLKLRPLGNPGKYRVRDLWTTQAGAQLVRLTTDGNFTAKATGRGLWAVDYAQSADGSWYLSSELSDDSVSADDDNTYARMRVRFLDVAADPREVYDVGITSESVPILEEP